MKYDLRSCKIRIADILREYKSSEPFKQQLDSGQYVYVENRLCLNHPKYIKWDGTLALLTNYAREHENECCLVFTITIIQSGPVYEQQRDGTLLAFMTQPSASAPKYQPDQVQAQTHMEKLAETSKDVISLARKLPTNLPSMLDKLIKDKGVKEEDLA